MSENYASPRSQQQDYPYFRRVWNNVVVALLAVSFIPLIVIGGGIYYYAASVLKNKTLDSLRMEVTNHRKAIDQFLEERTMSLKLISKNLSLMSLDRPAELQTALEFLHKDLPWFVDLGVIDDQGRHLAYAGPFDLISKNYKDAGWFKAVKAQSVFISDVFSGFRNVPHFIIAIKQTGGQGVRIIRATIDTVYFNDIVSEMVGQRKGDAYLVNRDGIFQTNPRTAGKLMGRSSLKDLERFSGVKLEERGGQVFLTVWQEKVSWLCVVQMDRDDIFSTLHRLRNLGVLVFILVAFLIVATVLLTTNYLVSQLESKRRSIRFLDQQLRQTGQMASSMQLSYDLFGEIKDTLVNIDVATAWIRDLSRKGNIDEAEESLEQIKSQVIRSQRLIDKFLSVTQPDGLGPIITEINVNDLLDDLLELLNRELHFNNIRVNRDYQDDLPGVRSDLPQLRQVFLNLILNAMFAIRTDGEIIIKTHAAGDQLQVMVTDDGPGIPRENIEKIFSPLFTTKPQGIGLGLSICESSLKKLGGGISVESEPGQGATFTITLSLQRKSSVF